MMNRLTGAILGVCLAAIVPATAVAQPAASAQADDPAKLDEAHRIIAIMYPPAERLHMIEKLQDDMLAQMRPMLGASLAVDPGLTAIFNDYIAQATARQRAATQKHIPLMFEAMASAYTREFSLAELKDVRAFAQTPSGAHYLSRSPAIVGDPAVAKVNTAMFQDIHAITQAMVPEFRDKVIAYLKAHPDVAAKLDAANKKN